MIKLQGIGNYQSKLGKDLVVGDLTVWNYGYLEKVVGITPSKTGKTIILEIEHLNSRDEVVIASRKISADREVGFYKNDMNYNLLIQGNRI